MLISSQQDDRRGHGAAKRMFKFSLLYLALLFAAMVVDRGLLA